MAANVKLISLPSQKSAKIVKWKVKPGSNVSQGTILMLYKTEGSDVSAKLKSEVTGNVVDILASVGADVQPGAPLLKIRGGCSHSVVMKDMCAECGADLREEKQEQTDTSDTKASVAMVHSIPELRVSEKQAIELGKADEERLLKNRKLVLLVDLDQTLIHTTNDNVPPKLKGVYHFQLWNGQQNVWYHTKFRPKTEEFLTAISKLFELHICTFGARLYAHTMARLLDPEEKFFSHRILSRDECFDPRTKTANLKSLFPCGENMVCIIDDREDVWQFAPNLVHVKPYLFFKGTGDINAPPGSKQDGRTNEKRKANEEQEYESQKKKQKIEEKTDENSENMNEKSENEDQKSKREGSDCTAEEDIEEKNESTGDKKFEEEVVWEDEDDDNETKYLDCLLQILTRIHQKFYTTHDEKERGQCTDLPNLKDIIPLEKKKVLAGTNVVFSGVFPTNIPLEKSRAYIVSKSLGANVQTGIVKTSGESIEPMTTHVIAARRGTAKVNQALRSKHVKVVHPDWLWTANERWERPPEKDFPLNKETESPSPTPDFAQKVMTKNESKRKSDAVDKEDEAPVYDPVSGKRVWKNKKAKVESENQKSDPQSSTLEDDNMDTDEAQPGTSGANAAVGRERRFSDSYSPLIGFSKEDLDDMDKEVEEAFSDSSETSDNEEEKAEGGESDEELRRKVLGQKDDSSSDESLSGDTPRGWKKKYVQTKLVKKVTRAEKSPIREELDLFDEGAHPEFEPDAQDKLDNLEKSFGFDLSSDSDSDVDEDKDFDSIGSVDEEMAAAVEREFLNF